MHRFWPSAALLAAFLAQPAAAQPAADPPAGAKPPAMTGRTDFSALLAGRKDGDSYEEVIKGYEKVVSTADGQPSLFTLWIDKKDGKLLAELPFDYERRKFFFALTTASGEVFAGLQAGELYGYWKKYGNNLALIEKQLDTRSGGDKESKASVERLYTDRLVADLPVLATSPKGGPVISLDNLFVMQAAKFFTNLPRGEEFRTWPRIRSVKTAKAFPKNVEVGFELPMPGGVFKTLHYSVSEIPDETGYRPREADDRVGYFTTGYNDYGKYTGETARVRYVNRWHLEKADPSLKVSPPKQPIVFYLEHTTPIRYRRFVRDGVLYWNKAFEKVGLVNAVEVYQQDAATGAHMDKDPEDVRYNFVRWLNNNVSTAIGPSRVHPLTGQILDADIILTDGWIRTFEKQFSELLPQLAVEGFGPETHAWLAERPLFDPRVLLAPPHERERLFAEGHRRAAGPLGAARERGTDGAFDALVGRNLPGNGFCLAAAGKGLDMTLLRMADALAADKLGADEADERIDGVPAAFIGPLLADLVAHEVGHTLGLRHNFAASGLYSLADINSNKLKGKKPFAASVMDYLPVNINMGDGEVQGDFAMIGVGDYDEWAIEYGYTFEKNLKPILARAKEPALRYATDQDTVGPDPMARRYDFSSNPLDYARNQTKLAKHHRGRLVEKYVKGGDSWAKARKGYELTLNLQVRALGMMANWVGGAHVRREHKGDGQKPPIEAVSPATQRDALAWVIDNAFTDEAFGLTPELLQHLKNDTLAADEGFSLMRLEEGTFPVHDRVMGVQSSVLTMLVNPTTLRRVYDNELLLPADKDAFTIPELLDTVSASVWAELGRKPAGKATARKPLITSLRRNLQRTYVERLIDLAVSGAGSGAASKPIANLAMLQLRTLNAKLADALKALDESLDPYSKAHLLDAQTRITKALESQYILNAKDIGGGMRLPFILFGAAPCQHAAAGNACRACLQQVPQGWSDERQAERR